MNVREISSEHATARQITSATWPIMIFIVLGSVTNSQDHTMMVVAVAASTAIETCAAPCRAASRGESPMACKR